MMKRFVIETKEQAVIDTINEWQISNPEKKIKPLISVISEYDKDKFNKQMEDIRESLRILRDGKISKDVMIAYIRSKNIPASTAKAVIEAQEDFFRKMGVL